MATIKDVARVAKVSVGTVSNYLNGTTPVADAKARRIRAAIDELGYQVDLAARSLRVGATRTVGLLVPNISNPFFGEIARGIEHALTEHGYQTFLCDSGDDPQREQAYLANLASRRVDGVLVIYADQDADPGRLQDQVDVPLVYVDRGVPGRASVTMDNHLGGRLAARHLLELGHERIGAMVGRPEVANVAARLKGFREELEAHGVALPPERILTGRQTLAFGDEVERLIALRDRPTAIFATNDIVAVGAWLKATSLGLSVPGDLSLMGFDDIELARAIRPPLSTVAQDVPEMAQRAVARLLSLIPSEVAAAAAPHDAAPSNDVPIEPRLIVRGSTTRPASPRRDQEREVTPLQKRR